MAKKIIAGVVVVVLAVVIALFAAEKPQGKKAVEKPTKEVMVEQLEEHEGLLDQLIAAYKADDQEKMGEIIKKMEQRREKMQRFARADRWHKWEHRRWAMAGPSWGQGRGMAGSCPMMGVGGCGMPPGGQPCQCPCGMGGMRGWGPPAGGFMPMRNWGPAQSPGWGRGQGWRQGAGQQCCASGV